ncbi:Hsp20/alpha crystallin family protein [Salinispora arenicola]|uniref:Hsp20/alpha crystallin family protein n=1 Tax=Salinispora arenicola TaxID=168697 RepID=UPI00207AF78E|nr:Hsp20/alpha crystallin family protein [Salinispora arenicola]MCN0180340.1 Hsp20/alpha crystallin family protein [Salinispora arenicola]
MREPGGEISQGWRGQGWDPMGELQMLRAELGRLVGGRSDSRDLRLDETADGWEVVVRLPGVAPEEVAVELDDRELCVRARSEAEVNADYGIPGGSENRGFVYRVDLPSRVDPDAIDAVMNHGLLRVRLPRATRPAPRTITVGRTGARGPGSNAPLPVDPAVDREVHHPNAAPHRP